MWEMRAFENSLRGGPDAAARMKNTSKAELIRQHHKSCTGAFHGCGVGKNKRNQIIAETTRCCQETSLLNENKNNGRPNSLELSDTDSGQESLVSPLRSSKTESLEDDLQEMKPNDVVKEDSCCSCECHCKPVAISEDEMLKRLKELTSADATSDANKLNQRRKKRNQRIAEHVDGGAPASVTAREKTKPMNVPPVVVITVQEPETEDTQEVVIQEGVKETKTVENGDQRCGEVIGTELSSKSCNGNEPVPKTTSKKATKATTKRVSFNNKVQQSDENSRKITPSKVGNTPAVKKVSKCDSKSPDYNGVARSSANAKVLTGRVAVNRRPPVVSSSSRGFAVPGVTKVEWRELYDIAVNKKPGNTGNVLYKDIHEIICDSLLNELKAKSDDQLANEKAWLEAERLWLVHRAGFTASRRLHDDNDVQAALVNGDVGKVTIRLEASDDVLHVDDDDVEKANPPQFDHAEDLGHLRYLNESSSLHTLRQRYASNLLHTYAGAALVVVNPMAPLAIYSDKVVSMFRGCKSEDMPPHIYSMAQSAYRGMLASRRDQAIVLLGRSGSGKTTNFKHVLHYLLLAAGSANKLVTIEKINAVATVLEAFGNARTALNANATRFTQIFSLDFDQSGLISSASIQVLLLERSRVARRPDGESSFHVLYQLLSGAEGQLRRQLCLDAAPPEGNPFIAVPGKHEERHKAALDFARLCASLTVLGVSEVEQKVLWSVLAAIYHLGYAGAVRAGTSSRWQFSSPQSAQHAAQLLGTSVEELARTMFGSGGGTPSAPRAPFRTPSPTEVRVGDVTGTEALEGMVTGLYSEAFNAVAALINRSISASIHTVSSLIIVDAPGFQNPASCGHHQGGATFEDLCHNYLHERLQLLFHHTSLTSPRDRYVQENIDCQCDEVDDMAGPAPMVALLDRAAQSSLLRTSQTDLRDADRRGLLWLLDEQAVFPCATEEAFLERLFQHYSDRDHQALLRKAPGHNQFILQHLQGTNPVLYSANGWLKASRENPITKTVISILQESNREEVSQLFVSCRGSGVSGGSIVGIEGTQSLRRASSIRRTFTSGAAGIKRKSLCLQVKFTVDGLVETLRRTRLKFVHCFLPQHSAGLIDIRGSTISNDDELINIPLLRSQLRGSQLLPAVRLHKQGFPKVLPLPEFRRRFRLLSPLETRPASPVADERLAVEDMLIGMDLDITSYRVGLSQIFFRPGVLAQLEGQRDERLSAHVVGLQSRCRGYLARRKLAKLRLQDTAIRCIQRNVRKLLSVQDWPWWRLLAKVTPLLDVHRTEEQLKLTQEELESLRAKVEKLDTERGHLQHDNDKLSAKLSEMTADLADEHSTSILATERLEAETSERLRLERELQEMQVHQQSLSATSERLEMELLYLRAADGASEDDEEGAGGADAGVYKQRYERTLRELELTKHRLHQQHEDDLEQLVALKKQLEKKLGDAYEEVNEQRQVAGQWKRKVQKLTSETNDLRLLLEEQNSRNTLLEKKQRRFDGEFQSLQEQLRQEKQHRERASREREMALGEKYTLEQNLSATKLELELKEEHANALSRELDELATGGHTDLEVAALKRAKHELDKKLTEQEEELDDLAGQLSLVSQAKLRMEMSLEQQRKEARREQAQRDEELEEVRCNATKKVKALESQLESEHEERTQLLREKHDLERRLTAAQDAAGRSQRDVEVTTKLKRDLKRTRALLKDATIQLQKTATDAPSKALLRQLRNQLEDAELARASAVKSRQTAEAELSDVQAQLDECQRARSDAEEKAASSLRTGQELRTQLDENEEELAEVLKKYRGSVAQLSAAQAATQDAVAQCAQVDSERASLREQLTELAARLECVETSGEAGGAMAQRRMELRAREMESRLELEQTTRARMEVQISRLKDSVEKLQADAAVARTKEQTALTDSRKLSRALREAREEVSACAAREADVTQRKKEAESRLEAAQAETQAAKADLRLALTRINDLQAAIQDDCSQSESDHESDSDESIESFLVNNETKATWNESRLSLSRSPARRSPSSELESSKSGETLPKKIADTTTKESYA